MKLNKNNKKFWNNKFKLPKATNKINTKVNKIIDIL